MKRRRGKEALRVNVQVLFTEKDAGRLRKVSERRGESLVEWCRRVLLEVAGLELEEEDLVQESVVEEEEVWGRVVLCERCMRLGMAVCDACRAKILGE